MRREVRVHVVRVRIIVQLMTTLSSSARRLGLASEAHALANCEDIVREVHDELICLVAVDLAGREPIRQAGAIVQVTGVHEK